VKDTAYHILIPQVYWVAMKFLEGVGRVYLTLYKLLLHKCHRGQLTYWLKFSNQPLTPKDEIAYGLQG
jgi:hypothetical protein